MQSSHNSTCYIYSDVKRINNSTFWGINGFEGIPQNFFINFLFWLLLHSLFIILRKKAWNYGRMAVVQKDEIKWADMFYAGGDGDDLSLGSYGSMSGNRAVMVASNTSEHVDPVHTQHPNLYQGSAGVSDEDVQEAAARLDLESHQDQIGRTSSSIARSQLKFQHYSEIMDKGYFSWIKIVFTLTDKQYREKCGSDCVHYLSFQRHLIFLATIITFCSLVIILPVNMQRTLTGEDRAEKKSQKIMFTDTTIIHLGSKFDFLWFHVILAMLFLFISIAVMRHFSKELQISEEDIMESSSRTIEIIGVNRRKCNEEMLRAHLEETYPGTEITEISFAYDISNLEWVEFQRLSAASAKLFFRSVYEKRKQHNPTQAKRPTMKPYMFGKISCKCCCCCNKETDAIEYYERREHKYALEAEKERKKALTKPLGIAFVTFNSVESAENIVEDYACSARIFLHAPVSRYTKELHSNQWIVKFAPRPEDIMWQNLSTDYKVWYFRFFTTNIVVAIIAAIFSTPVSLFKSFDFLPTQSKHKASDRIRTEGFTIQVMTGLILDTFPTLILWIMSVTLIAVVCRSDLIIGFWTKTAGNLSEMIKTFFFLTFMIIVLPSLGKTSISYFFDKNNNLGWSCIFYKDNGAFFVNYVCTSSLVGTAAELMRLPELFVYAIKLSLAKSEAETTAIRKSVLWDFQIGIAYAWTMLHFAIFTCFSVIYPLVTPFGLVYLCLKHFTDRYNIYFAYAPCKVDKDVHATAVNFVIMSMFMLQLNLLAYVHFYIGDNQYHDQDLSTVTDAKIRALQICSLLGFSITAAFFLGQCCFNVCADFSPIHQYKNILPDDEIDENEDPQGKRRRSTLTSMDSPSKVDSSPGNLHNNVTFDPMEAQDMTERRNSKELGMSEPTTTRAKGYGRYIPALLRPEFAKFALNIGHNHYQEHNENADNIANEP